MQNQYPTVLKRKPKQPAVKQGDGEEELPFNRKTAIFLLSSRFWENYNYKTITQMFGYPIEVCCCENI